MQTQHEYEDEATFWKKLAIELSSKYLSVADALGFDAVALTDVDDIHDAVLSRATACHDIAMEHGIGGAEHAL